MSPWFRPRTRHVLRGDKLMPLNSFLKHQQMDGSHWFGALWYLIFNSSHQASAGTERGGHQSISVRHVLDATQRKGWVLSEPRHRWFIIINSAVSKTVLQTNRNSVVASSVVYGRCFRQNRCLHMMICVAGGFQMRFGMI